MSLVKHKGIGGCEFYSPPGPTDEDYEFRIPDEKDNSLKTLETIEKVAQIQGFYHLPVWDETKTVPKYFDWFSWGNFSLYAPEKQEFWSRQRYGYFKYELINSFLRKIYFLKGILKDHCGYTKIEEGRIEFANATEQWKKCIEYLNEIINTCFLNKNYKVEESQFYGYPLCNSIKVNKEVLEFIRDFQYPKDEVNKYYTKDI